MKKLYENISVYDISHKTSAGPKPVRFNKTVKRQSCNNK